MSEVEVGGVTYHVPPEEELPTGPWHNQVWHDLVRILGEVAFTSRLFWCLPWHRRSDLIVWEKPLVTNLLSAFRKELCHNMNQHDTTSQNQPRIQSFNILHPVDLTPKWPSGRTHQVRVLGNSSSVAAIGPMGSQAQADQSLHSTRSSTPLQRADSRCGDQRKWTSCWRYKRIQENMKYNCWSFTYKFCPLPFFGAFPGLLYSGPLRRWPWRSDTWDCLLWFKR